MFILKLAGKILLLPVWLILFVIGLAVKMTVQTYAVVRGILVETQLLNHEPINSGGQEIMTHRISRCASAYLPCHV